MLYYRLRYNPNLAYQPKGVQAITQQCTLFKDDISALCQ